MPKLIIVRRTDNEMRIFPGDVYIDIDGNNEGIVRSENLEKILTSGVHHIKMYQSHKYSTFVGFYEVDIDFSDEKDRFIIYTSTLTTDKPGHILVSIFNNYSQIDDLVNRRENQIAIDYQKDAIIENKIVNESKNFNTIMIIAFIILPIIGGIIWFIWYMIEIDTIFDILEYVNVYLNIL